MALQIESLPNCWKASIKICKKSIKTVKIILIGINPSFYHLARSVRRACSFNLRFESSHPGWKKILQQFGSGVRVWLVVELLIIRQAQWPVPATPRTDQTILPLTIDRKEIFG